MISSSHLWSVHHT